MAYIENLRSALTRFANDKRFIDGELGDALGFLLEAICLALECERASVWEYFADPEPSIRCLDLRTARGQVPGGAGATLGYDEAASYLDALVGEPVLAIDDVNSDPRCRQLARDYLPANDISSMLDAPYQVDGRLHGVLCLEHTGPARTWSIEEQHFSANIASLVSIAFERQRRRESERRLREQEERYRQLVENSPSGILIHIDGIVQYANDSIARIGAYSSGAEVVGLPITRLVAMPDTPRALDNIREMNSTEELLGVREYRIPVQGSTEERVVEVSSTMVQWEGRQAIQSVVRDVSEQVRARQVLRRSEALLVDAETIAAMGSWSYHVDTDSLQHSRGLLRILDVADELTSIDAYFAFIVDEDRQRVSAQVKACRDDATPYETVYRVETGNGDLRWVEERGVARVDDDRVVSVSATLRDVTERKQAEQQARHNEQRVRTLIDFIPGGFIYGDAEGRCQLANSNFANWLKLDLSEITDIPVETLIGQDNYRALAGHVEKALAGVGVTSDVHLAFPNVSHMEVQAYFVPDLDVSGVVRGYYALLMDVTAVRQTERALRQAQKMEAVGQLTGGIAHDFNNLLTIAMGNLELLESGLPTGGPMSAFVHAAQQAVERGASLTNKMLSFSRQKSKGAEFINVNEIVENLRELLTQSLTASVRVSLDLQPDVWNTFADGGDLQDAILNLALNARDALNGSGSVTISTSNLDLDAQPALGILEVPPTSRYVVVSVRDDGIGIPPGVKERMFDPFFTTKEEGQGTGLGLSMVYGFMQRSGGQIQVQSDAGSGTEVRLLLPRAEQERRLENTRALGSDHLPAGTERILCVDDEEMLLGLAVRLLRSLGYEVETAATGEDALGLLAEHEFDLLFSDVILGAGIDGYDLAREALRSNPALKVLLTSGYDRSRNRAGDLEAELGRRLLAKPYSLADLANHVRRTLDQPPLKIA